MSGSRDTREAPLRVSRRSFFKAGAASAILTGLWRQSWAAPPKGLPSLKVLFYTDVHAGFDDEVAYPLSLAAEVMKSVPADVVICGGDMIHRGFVSTVEQCVPRFAQYKKFLREFGRPVEHVIGNHDLAGGCPADGSPPAKNPRAMVMEELGIKKPYRTFEVGDYRFVILDSIVLTCGDPEYHGLIDEEQVEWLREGLREWPKEQPIVLVTHIPFRTTFLQAKDGPETGLPENLVVGNANEILALFAGRDVPLILQGHLHSNEVINWAGQKFLMGGAICGGWWRGPNLQTGFGFGVVEFGDGRIDWEYRGYGWEV